MRRNGRQGSRFPARNGAGSTARVLAGVSLVALAWWPVLAGAQSAPGKPAGGAPAETAKSGDGSRDVVIHASALPKGALSEFSFWPDPAASGGKLVGTPNTGGHLDPPPENDPYVKFTARVEGGVPYRCWVRMKVGAPKGQSQANMLWVQFTNAVDKAGKEILKPGTGSYLTAQGPKQQGWAWVACMAGSAKPAESLVSFKSSGEVTVRMQAGMEGVGFDQLLLSPARYLEKPPSEAVVKP